MAILLILELASVCLSAPVKLQKVDKLKGNTNSSRSSPLFSNCLMTCLAGRSRQICFDVFVDIDHARPAPRLPDHVCKATGCRKPTETCQTKKTTFPFRCMLQRRSVVHRSDVQNASMSVCNVPVKRMKSCVFSPASGNSKVFSHAEKVRFETRPRGSTALESKTCVCYDGQWLARQAFKLNRRKAVKKSGIFCDVQSSNTLEYLRVEKAKKPQFPKNGVFQERLSDEFKAIENWGHLAPSSRRSQDNWLPFEHSRDYSIRQLRDYLFEWLEHTGQKLTSYSLPNWRWTHRPS